jgi:hypothetical protein
MRTDPALFPNQTKIYPGLTQGSYFEANLESRPGISETPFFIIYDYTLK